MTATSDGFKIGEEDLKLRGPGELLGTAQSGELSLAVGRPLQGTRSCWPSRAPTPTNS